MQDSDSWSVWGPPSSPHLSRPCPGGILRLVELLASYEPESSTEHRRHNDHQQEVQSLGRLLAITLLA